MKREKLINSYSESLHKEKELFFNGFDKKNKDNKQKIYYIINKINYKLK